MKNAVFAFIIAGITSPCLADIYKCVSAQGEVAYGDSPCQEDARTEKLALPEELAVTPESSANANHETMEHINGALDIYHKTREETAANNAAHPNTIPTPSADQEQSPAIPDPAPIYYGGIPFHNRHPRHHHGDAHDARDGTGHPQMNKGDPNWVLQTPDNSYEARQARQRASMEATTHRQPARDAHGDEETNQ
jgi:hypothetical protein